MPNVSTCWYVVSWYDMYCTIVISSEVTTAEGSCPSPSEVTVNTASSYCLIERDMTPPMISSLVGTMSHSRIQTGKLCLVVDFNKHIMYANQKYQLIILSLKQSSITWSPLHLIMDASYLRLYLHTQCSRGFSTNSVVINSVTN